MEDYSQIDKSELIKSFDENKSFFIKVYVSTNKQPFFNDYLSDLNYELEGKLHSIEDDIIKIDGKKSYFFDNDDDNLTGIFTVDELTNECYNDSSGETMYYIKYIDSMKSSEKIQKEDNVLSKENKKHKMESNNENLKIKQHKNK